MTWTNPIDRFPQVPQDWANHIIYGGAIADVLMLFHASPLVAALVVLALGAFKKTVDFFKEAEPAWMCIGKTLVGAAVPLAYVLVEYVQKA